MGTLLRKYFIFLLILCLYACQNTDDGKGDSEETQTYQKSSYTDEGKIVFRRCASCHSLEKDKHRAGPSLYLIFGKRSGTTPYFPYSQKMKSAEIYWDRAALKKFLFAPREMIPGNRMAFQGIKDDKDLEALLDFLAEKTK